MKNLISSGIAFGLILMIALSLTLVSSGITHFSADRDVSMRVADSENALIGIPENITVEFLLNTTRNKQNVNVNHNFTIKNNLNQQITLVHIKFSNSILNDFAGCLTLNPGEQRAIDILLNIQEDDTLESLLQYGDNSDAELKFVWDDGQIIINKNIRISISENAR